VKCNIDLVEKVKKRDQLEDQDLDGNNVKVVLKK